MSTKLIFGGLLLLATIFSVILWIFEPTIHYFDSVNVNTMDRRDFTMDDRLDFSFSCNVMYLCYTKI